MRLNDLFCHRPFRHQKLRPMATTPTTTLWAVAMVSCGIALGGTASAQGDGEEIDIYDARSCPEIFGDDEVLATNRARRQSRFHGISRGSTDLTLTHQVPWWTEPKRVRLPHAMVVDVLAEETDESDLSSPESGDPSSDGRGVDATGSDATGSDPTGSDVNGSDASGADAPATSADPAEAGASAGEDAAPSVHEAEAKAASEGAGLVVRHGSVNGKKKMPNTVSSTNLLAAHIELSEDYAAICEPGVYEVTVDDSLGQDSRIYAILSEGLLIENGDTLGFLVLEDGPAVPSMRMIWRSAYAIQFEDPNAKSTVKKAKPKPKRRARRRR